MCALASFSPAHLASGITSMANQDRFWMHTTRNCMYHVWHTKRGLEMMCLFQELSTVHVCASLVSSFTRQARQSSSLAYAHASYGPAWHAHQGHGAGASSPGDLGRPDVHSIDVGGMSGPLFQGHRLQVCLHHMLLLRTHMQAAGWCIFIRIAGLDSWL